MLEVGRAAVVRVGHLAGNVHAAEVGEQAQLVRMLRRAQLGGLPQVAPVHHQHPVGMLEFVAPERPRAQVRQLVAALPRMLDAAAVGRFAGMPGFQPGRIDAQPMLQPERGDALAQHRMCGGAAADVAGADEDHMLRLHSTSSARKSLTLVKVGPGTTRSPRAWKKL